MSFDNFLNQICTIKRPTKTGVDRYNANAYSDSTVASNVRCRMIEKSMKVMDAKTSEYSWVKVKVLLFAVGTDVKAKDEITLDTVVYVVADYLKRQRGNEQHHIACVVETANV